MDRGYLNVEAVRYLAERDVAICEAVYGPSSIHTTDSRFNLAAVLAEYGETELAITYMREAAANLGAEGARIVAGDALAWLSRTATREETASGRREGT